MTSVKFTVVSFLAYGLVACGGSGGEAISVTDGVAANSGAATPISSTGSTASGEGGNSDNQVLSNLSAVIKLIDRNDTDISSSVTPSQVFSTLWSNTSRSGPVYQDSDTNGTLDVSKTAYLTAINQTDFTHLLVFSVLESDASGDGYIVQNRSKISSGTNENTTNGINAVSLRQEIMTLAKQAAAYTESAQTRPQNVTLNCPDGGDITITGDLNSSTRIGVLQATYNDCQKGIVTKRGGTTIQLDKIDATYGVFTDYTIQYNGLSVITPGQYYVYTGSQDTVRTLTNGKITEYVVTSDLERVDMTANRTSLDRTVNTTTISGQKITGKLCDSLYGCVDLSTKIPFNLRWDEGEATMKGLFGSSIQVYYAKGLLYSRVDSSGHGTYGIPTQVTYGNPF